VNVPLTLVAGRHRKPHRDSPGDATELAEVACNTAVTIQLAHLIVDDIVAVVNAARQHLLAERYDARRVRQVPRLVVPHRAGGAATRLHLVDDEVRTRLQRKSRNQTPVDGLVPAAWVLVL